MRRLENPRQMVLAFEFDFGRGANLFFRQQSRSHCHNGIAPAFEHADVISIQPELLGDEHAWQHQCEFADKLALAAVDEAVDDLMRQLFEAGSEIADARRGKNPLNQLAMAGVTLAVTTLERRNIRPATLLQHGLVDGVTLAGEALPRRNLVQKRLGVPRDPARILVAADNIEIGFRHPVDRTLFVQELIELKGLILHMGFK